MVRLRLSSLLPRAASALLAGALMVLVGITPQSAHASTSGVVISQVYGGGGNSGATYKNDYIELFNAGTSPAALGAWSVQYASATGSTWTRTNLTSVTLQPGQYYLVQEAAGSGGSTNLPTPDATGSAAMSATSGKVALVSDQTTLTVTDPTSLAQFVDMVGYGPTANHEGAGAAPTLSSSTSALRAGGGCTDTDDNSADFTANDPSTQVHPRNTASPLHSCTVDTAPSLSSHIPASGATNVAPSANISLSFSEAVDVAAGWYDITCSDSGVHSAVVSGGPQFYSLNPDANFTSSESCTVTISASHVTDQDTNDPPDAMVSDAVFSFTVADLSVCGTTATPIHDVQGSGLTTPISGSLVTIEGVVIGSYQGSAGLNGFFVQEEDAQADSDPQTSEGVFVFDNGFNASVAVGDVARVTGRPVEFSGQTEVSSVSQVLVCGTAPLPAPTDVTLPFATSTSGEPTEGMRVRMHQTLSVSEVFDLGQFGEVLLSSGGRLPNPTNLVPPGPAAQAMEANNLLNQIVLDDGSSVQDPDPTPYMFDGPTLRVGDTVNDLTGVMSFNFGTYVIEPEGTVPFVRSNPRTPGPEPIGGTLRVAAMNVLNFFNGDGAGGGFPTPRGANTLTEYQRQRAKTIAAILGVNPDVAGLMEMENDDPNTEYSAIEDLVDGLNAATAPGTYAFINTGVLGTDQIRVAVIYKPAMVTPVGPWATITTGPFFDKSRPPIAQTFQENATGEKFTYVVNHLKSKGSCPTSTSDPNADQGDLQGCWNPLRVDSVNQELAWLATDPTGQGDPDVLIMGDMNAYAKEDPIAAWEAGGYTNLISQFIGAGAYSYVFNGESGYLDHALGNASILPHVTGVAEWHNNADEPTELDYNMEFKSAAQQALNVGTPYRASDHDPVVVGLTLGAPAVGLSTGSVSFGDQLVGTTSTAQDVTITNSGDLPLHLGLLSASGDFALSGDTCSSQVVPPSGTCTASLTFTPTAAGARTGALTIPSDAASSPDSVSLSGTGTQPGISLAPSSIDFGNQLVGTTSAAQDVTITNNGTASLNISTLSASGDFAVSGGTCGAAPFSVAAGDSCTVSLTFTPTATGARTGSLSVSSDAPGSPSSVSLSGTGTQPGVSVSPMGTITFGGQKAGTSSAPKTVTVTNSGTGSLTITALTAAGEFGVSNSTCGAAVIPGGTCTFNVTFSPTTAGNKTGSVSIVSNAPSSPDVVSLAGTGLTTTTPPVLLSPKNGALVYTPTPKLTWKPVMHATGYHVELSNSVDFNTVLQSADPTRTFTTTSPLDFGIYFWHVAVKDASGQSAYSTLSSFEVTLNKAPAKDATVRTHTPTFNWEKAIGAHSYMLQVNTQADFLGTMLVNVTRTTTSYMVPRSGQLPPGTYYWRVSPDGGAHWTLGWKFIVR